MIVANSRVNRIRHAFIITLVVVGLLLVLISLLSDQLGIDRTPGFGMVQMFLLLIGLTALTTAVFTYLFSQGEHMQRSLQADIGLRLAATGLTFAYVAGLADLLQIGTHPHPDFERPFVGWLQVTGIGVGLFSIVIGIFLFYTSRRLQGASSMEFIINGNGRSTETESEETG